ncbi:MAG: T9SS type A sorting domain-containing protein [Bacteroidetes bacterium]|nr:T9SS type A sorting domain-containing protein [Bacteroidota bacterium]
MKLKREGKSCHSSIKSYLFFFYSLFLITTASAQSYYPGGLGNANLQIWLNANKLSSVTYNGSKQVSKWADLSGHAYDFTQANTTKMPVYGSATGPNGNPALTFNNGNSQYLNLPNLPSSISFTGGVSSLSVVGFGTAGSMSWQRIFDFGNGQASDNTMIGRYGNSDNFYIEGWNGGSGDQTWTTTTPVVNGNSNIYEGVQQGGTAGTSTNVAFYLAGTAQASNGAAGSSKTYLPKALTRSKNYIGRSNWSSDAYYKGTMSEILFFNTALSNTQRIILENYLSAEWGLTVGASYYTPPSNTYNQNLVGIGYTSSTDNILSNVAGSTDGFGFSSGTSATDFLFSAGYAMAAHNGQTNTIRTGVNLTGITPTGLNLLNRSWYVHLSNGNATGNITVSFNFSDYNASSLPVGATSYALLYNATDGSFGSGTNKLVTKTYSTSGSTVSFTTSASNLPNGYYTLVWASSGTLPVILSSFTAEKQAGSVLLQWVDQSEKNSDYFDIERSVSGSNFISIGKIMSQGNSSTQNAYSFTDENPVSGTNNYRLRMVDLDGNYSYSDIRTVNFTSNSDADLNIYPNPVSTGSITISSKTIKGMVRIQIINSYGQFVQSYYEDLEGILVLPSNNLSRGSYLVRVIAPNTTVTTTIVKE